MAYISNMIVTGGGVVLLGLGLFGTLSDISLYLTVAGAVFIIASAAMAVSVYRDYK